MLIARLIADQVDDGTGLDARLDAASVALEDAGMRVASAGMLDFCGDVLQIALPDGDVRRVIDILDRHFGAVDLLVSDHPIEVPRLFVSDMDSTIIGQECIDELADFAGIKDKVAAITERAMAGEIDFANALAERVLLLRGLDEGAIGQCLAERIGPTAGAETLVATLKAHGCRSVLVTGGFHHFADAIAERLGFDRVVANRLAVVGGKLRGEIIGPISDAATKLATLENERTKLGEGARVLAIGDGANDVPMIQAADYGIAYRAKPAARDAASGRIDCGDLTSVLRLFAIPTNEWVTG